MMQRTMMWTFSTAVCLSLALGGLAGAAAPAEEERGLSVLPAAEVEWQQLNPARGDASPRAATLWGDRQGEQQTGFLVRFVDGFSSPPHIHNVSYRGVVLAGQVHNDDPEAAPMWMQPGSYWTQPAGGSHITSAQGADVIAFIEIDSGPYLVQPVDEAFDRGELPVNVDASNLVWLNADRLGWAAGAEVSFLWGDPDSQTDPSGLLLRLPAGGEVTLGAEDQQTGFRVVVVDGSVAVDGRAGLTSGSLITSGGAEAPLSCAGQGGCTVYVRREGGFAVR